MTPDHHRLAEDYLRRLWLAGRTLPPDRRAELSAEIEAHLAEAIAPGASPAEARAVLARLGSPEDIIEAEQPVGLGAAERPGWREWGAVILLPLGWLAGLVLLWSSRLWTTRDKLIGTLIVPGGIATAFVVVLLTATTRRCAQTTSVMVTRAGQTVSRSPSHCTSSAAPGALATTWHIALIAFVALGPVLCAVYLARRASTPTGAPRLGQMR